MIYQRLLPDTNTWLDISQSEFNSLFGDKNNTVRALAPYCTNQGQHTPLTTQSGDTK